MTADALLDRAAELKRQLVEYSRSGRYDRAFKERLADLGQRVEEGDEGWNLLWDTFLLNHRLRNGRTVLDQFVDARGDLSQEDRDLLLGWHDVVTGPFEVQRRDGSALILVNLVDDLTYRARVTADTGGLRRMPKRSFLLTRLVRVGDEWMFSGSTSVLPPAERDVAHRLALDLSMQVPQAAYRNPERLARAWELQRAERRRFIEFFGSDVVVFPGREAQQRLDEFLTYSNEQLVRETATPPSRAPAAPQLTLPAELIGSGAVAFVFDEEDGLGFLEDFGPVEEAFADPDLIRHRHHRNRVRSCLDNDDVPPVVLRRLAERNPERATTLFRQLLKQPAFDWAQDGEELLRAAKPDYFARPHLPQVTPVSDRLAAYARRR
jgi:hypothetical protein